MEEPIYETETRCKLCMSSEREVIELWFYTLKRNYTYIVNYVNENTNFDCKPLNIANLSVHFGRHVNEEGFWETHPQLSWIKKQQYEERKTALR